MIYIKSRGPESEVLVCKTRETGALPVRDSYENYGEMAEWTNAAVLKTVEGNTSGGSNPSFSAVLWCNGSTTVFGAVCSSSNLDRTTLFLCVNFYSIIFDLILFVYSPRPRWNVDRFPNRFLRTF